MTMSFMLDTCVLSETSRVKPHPSVVRFIETAEQIMIPVGSLMEFHRGIMMIAGTDPIRAVKLSGWYQQVLSSGIEIVPTDKDIGDTWGALASVPELQHLRYGQDPSAIVHRAAVATMDVNDFMLINSFHPIPGVYNPKTDIWHARMSPLEWPEQLSPVANDAENEALSLQGEVAAEGCIQFLANTTAP